MLVRHSAQEEGERRGRKEEEGERRRRKDALVPEEEDMLCYNKERVYSKANGGRRSRSGGSVR